MTPLWTTNLRRVNRATTPIRFTSSGFIGIILAAALASWSTTVAQTTKPIDFAHAVAPILKKHCLACHGGKESKGGFSLNTRELVLDAEAIVPGKADQSRLIELVVSRDDEEQMPPKGRPRLSDKEVAVLRRWVDAGAEWEPGMTFSEKTYEPPLRPRAVSLPPAIPGREHPVDRIIDHYLQALPTPQTPPAIVSDAEFARRAFLDLIGLLPTPKQLATFLADDRADKRERLVRQLLQDEIAYADHWLTFWNDLLRNDYTGTGFITGGRKRITGWLYASLVGNKPYDQFVRELIAPTPESEGFIVGIRWRGNVNASQTPEIQFAQNISQTLLGINMKCASCHDSFIDRWTLEETYGLAQVYSQSPLELHRCDKPTGKIAAAAWMFPELGQIDPKASQRERLEQLAKLMTHPENGRLSRTVVNRLWHRLMGRGIVHPVDAMHTAPFSEDLLDYLANDFVSEGYDLKHVMLRICTSKAYQAVIPPQADPPEPGRFVYMRPLPRRMTAEQFMDAVWQLTGAGPSTPDAKVMRVAPSNLKPQDHQSARGNRGQWIWDSPKASASAPAGQKLSFRHSFDLPQAPRSAVAAITADNSYQWWINGQRVGGDDNWNTVEVSAVGGFLKKGVNELLVVAANGGDSPNPAGLMVEVHWQDHQGRITTIGTDDHWQWSSGLPDKRGRFRDRKRLRWQSAAEVESGAVWNAVRPSLDQAFTLGLQASPHMVRASLVKNNPLMRALGRPNRDQIVTSRPTGLTTLEAIDLANGQLLADAIARGAQRAVQQHDTAPALVDWLFVHALSRQPSREERQLATDLLGEQPQARTVEDLIWSLLMLPEFQFVR